MATAAAPLPPCPTPPQVAPSSTLSPSSLLPSPPLPCLQPALSLSLQSSVPLTQCRLHAFMLPSTLVHPTPQRAMCSGPHTVSPCAPAEATLSTSTPVVQEKWFGGTHAFQDRVRGNDVRAADEVRQVRSACCAPSRKETRTSLDPGVLGQDPRSGGLPKARGAGANPHHCHRHVRFSREAHPNLECRRGGGVVASALGKGCHRRQATRPAADHRTSQPATVTCLLSFLPVSRVHRSSHAGPLLESTSRPHQ